jgi:hypothetical protein
MALNTHPGWQKFYVIVSTQSPFYTSRLDLLSYNIVSSKDRGRVQPKMQVDGDVHYGGKEIFDRQKSPVWGP